MYIWWLLKLHYSLSWILDLSFMEHEIFCFSTFLFLKINLYWKKHYKKSPDSIRKFSNQNWVIWGSLAKTWTAWFKFLETGRTLKTLPENLTYLNNLNYPKALIFAAALVANRPITFVKLDSIIRGIKHTTLVELSSASLFYFFKFRALVYRWVWKLIHLFFLFDFKFLS